jgi:hypothetical protein
MKKFLIVAIAVLAMASTSDAYAQSWGRRGADARCRHGGTVNGVWYCNLKNAPRTATNARGIPNPRMCGLRPCR